MAKQEHDSGRGTHSVRSASVRKLDIGLLIAFEMLMQERHVTRAARRLGMTQSALSGALGRLRSILKDDLFLRSANGMQPTPFAAELLSPVQEALDILQTLVDRSAVFSPRAHHEFTIGMSDYPSCLIAPALIKRLRAEFQNLTVHIEAVSPHSAPALLDNGRIDLMIAPLVMSAGHLQHRRLLSDSFLTVMSSHNSATQAELDLDRFTSLPHMLVAPDGLTASWRGLLDEKLSEIGRTREVRITLAHFLLGFLALEETDLLFTLPARLAHVGAALFGAVVKVPPTQPGSFTIAQFWHTRNDSLPSNMWLRNLIQNIAVSVDQISTHAGT